MPTKSPRLQDRLETRPRRRFVRRLVAAAMLIGSGLALGGCAGSFFDRVSSDEMSNTSWSAPSKPRPMRTSSYVRSGSQPILPPVPEVETGLEPIKVSSLIN